MISEKEIVLFETEDKIVSFPIEVRNETVWLSANQMSSLFERDEKIIRKHVNNVFNEGEVDKENNTQKMRVVGVTQLVPFYSLDVIISVGYRVKSNRGVEFRRWVNYVLKQYILQGYAVNQKRIEDATLVALTIMIVKPRAEEKAEEKEMMVNVVMNCIMQGNFIGQQMIIIELGGDAMKVLFQRKGSKINLVDPERRIFNVDGYFINAAGEETRVEEDLCKREEPNNYDEDDWYEHWMDYEGLDEPLKSESIVEPIYEIDDVFGQFGFKNKEGKFVIEPQFAYAYEFTNGLAAVNLGRTWYRTEDGKRYYENHYGYIDSKGKTIIEFQYDEAYPFNKYGVAVVSDRDTGWRLIDQTGKEVPGTRFSYLSPYYEYNDRFLEFSYEQKTGEETVGIYDTKERKILMEPSATSIIEWKEDCILVYEGNGEYGESDFRQYYINSKGEIIYPWLYGKGFAIVRRPDVNNVSAVAITKYTELTGSPNNYFLYNGKKYDRKFVYGLYSSKGEYIVPMEYEEIQKIGDNFWVCHKDGEILVVETEKGD